MDPNSLLKDQIRHKLAEVTLSSKHVKDAASFLLTQAEHSDFISSQWLEIFRNTNDPSFQLALLYVANEILTKSPKYGVSEFGEALKPFVMQATQFLRPGQFISKLTKLINYWTYRKVFDIKFTEQILQRLTATEQVDKKNVTPLSRYNADDIVKNFSPEKLLDTLRRIKQLDEICESHGKLDISPLGFGSPIMSTVSSLKSKEESRTLTAQVDKCCKHLEFIHKKYEERLEQMSTLQSILEGAEIYYNVQLKEVAVVVNAYGTYGKRVTKTLSQLHDLFHKDHISSPTNTTTSSQHQAKSNVNAHDHDEQAALLKQSTKYNKENSLNEPCYSGDEYYDDLEGGLSHTDDDNDDIGRDGGVSHHGNEDADDNNYYQHKDGSKIKQSPNNISQKVTTDSLANRISNQSTNIFNLSDNNSPAKLTDKPIHLNTLQSSCSKSTPFGFPIFQPVCDASGDVDYRVLLNPTLSQLASNGDNLRLEMNQSSQSQSSVVNNLNSFEVSPTHSLSNKPKMNHHDNCTVHTNYSDKSKNVHKTYSTSMNVKDTFVGRHHSQHYDTPDKSSHPIIEDEEDNMEVSDGDEPDANDADDRILDDKKVDIKNRPISTTVCSQLDKDWRLLTQQVKYDIKSASCLPHTSTANDNDNSNSPIPNLSPKSSVELIYPTPPRLPTASPIRIPPPPPPPPLVGLDPYSFSPPPPLPSTLNELAYQAPLTKKSDLFIPQPPVAPTIPHVPLDLKQINMMMMPTTNDSAKAIEQPQSCINSSSEMIQSQNYSPNDLLKNLFQPPPIISKSPSLLLSPSISLFSNLVVTASTTLLTTCSSSTENAMSLLPSSGSSSSSSSSNIPILSNIQQGMMNTLSCITNLPMANKFDASAPASSSSCELNTIQQNTSKHVEDPFAVISRLTGLSNLMKNIPTQSNLITLPMTPILSNPPPESCHETPTVTSSDSCCKTNVIHDSLSLSSVNSDLKPTYCLQPIMTSATSTTTSTTNSYIPHAKRSRFSDIVTNVENNNILPSTTSLAVNTVETTLLPCIISSTSSDDLLLPSSTSEKSSISKYSTNIVDHCTDKEEDKQQMRKSLSPNNDNFLRSRSNSISDSNSSVGGETPTLDERQDDLLSGNDKDRSLMSFHAFGTPTSSLADFLIPSTCHATDPKSFLQNIPHSVTSQTSVIPSLTRSYGLPFSSISNSAHSNTSSIPVNPINMPPSQLSMMRPTMLITNNNPNLPVSNSQFPGLTHSSMMFYEPTRMPITPRPLVPGSILMPPTQTRPVTVAAAVSQGNVRLPTTPFCGPPNWTQPLGVDQSTALQRPPPSDFWALMSSVPPPPPPPPVHPNVPQLPAFTSLNPTHQIHPVVGMFNPNSWMFTSPSTNNRDKQ